MYAPIHLESICVPARRFPIHPSRCEQASLLEELERVGSAELAGGTLPARAVVAEGGRAAAALLGTLLDEPVRRISRYAASMRAPLEKLHGREQGVWTA